MTSFSRSAVLVYPELPSTMGHQTQHSCLLSSAVLKTFREWEPQYFRRKRGGERYERRVKTMTAHHGESKEMLIPRHKAIFGGMFNVCSIKPILYYILLD
ncbi:hypothetical protein OnM2_035093 [Erysiphe neolycopersici]|uniref:Uncharacterized protein n=1 Tax=Erysiphe neolycopersici TaxID=212602 RepID=A0A420HXM5_9PEZI|nr:hypothetical protein OnM2_035093 [Erysiphe neolycopersici]